MVSLAARDPGDRDDDKPVGRQSDTPREPRRGSFAAPNQKSDTPRRTALMRRASTANRSRNRLSVYRLLAATCVRGPKTPAPRIARRLSGVWVSLISVPCTVISMRACVRHLESATGMKNGQSAAWTTS